MEVINLRNWLKELRVSKNLTQENLANLIGISRTMITEIENGNASPSIQSAKKIAYILGFSWIKFFDDGQVA